jgi:hypothetical protein
MEPVCQMKLKNTLRHLQGEDLITHLGNEYYDWTRGRVRKLESPWGHEPRRPVASMQTRLLHLHSIQKAPRSRKPE